MQRVSTSYAYAAEPHPFARSLPGKVVLGLAATLAVAVAAHISFPLPFTEVPLTLQPLAVLGVGLAFGPVGGFLVMLAYLAEGALGLPVFSPQGPGGVAQLVGGSGGYLMSYPLVAFLTGGLTRLLQKVRMPAFAAAAVGCTAAVVLLYLSGAGWLAFTRHLSLYAAWIQGVLPFVPGEIVKILAAAGIYSALARPRSA
jgi:biotin transport system substrate-specific component